MSSTLLPQHSQIADKAPLATATTKLPAQGKEDEKTDDFLSLILSKITNKEDGEKIAKILPNIELGKELEKLDESLLLKEATFVQILQLLEQLAGKKALKNFSKFNDKLNTLLKDGAILEEFKSAKSLKDILALSKKYNLGLEKINITQKDIQQLEKTFPNLAQQNFFQPKKAIIASEMLLKKSQNALAQNTTSTPKEKSDTSTLSRILQAIEGKKSEGKTAHQHQEVATKKPTSKVDVLPKVESLRQQSTTLTQETTLNIQSKTIQATQTNETLTQPLNKETLEISTQENSKNSELSPNAIKNSKPTLNTKTVDIKQTFNTFANDFKAQIEQYKPPLMKVQLALNPKHLGEMEVTIINRGSNLHVNFASNTQAMNLFIQNQAEFKNSLVNMGFTNLEMNFSDNRKNQEEKRENSNQNQGDELDNFDEIASGEETILDMVIPSYV